VHRDLKPDNLYLVADAEFPGGCRVKVLDFGVAKLASATLAGVSTTRTGQIIGTPLYMAPEQCHGANHVDARADIYSLGCILYHMLCGRPPFVSDGAGPVIAAHLYEVPVPPRARVADVPPRVDALVMRLLEKVPGDRPATMEEVEQLLAASVSGAVELPLVEEAMQSGPNRSRIVVTPSDGVVAGPVTQDVSGGAWESKPSVRRRRAPWVAMAGVALGALLMTSVAWKRGPRPSVTPAAGRPVATAPLVVAASAPAQPAPPARVSLRIDSRPAEAEVVRIADGVVLGRTPLVLELPAGDGAVTFRLRKRGYLPEELELTTRHDGQATVVLARRGAGAQTQPAAASIPAPRPAGRSQPRKSVKDGALDPFGID
jgi:hypothetical protein